ncbi:hypothetical protein HK405_010791, partial [Cladochytrium tenue]
RLADEYKDSPTGPSFYHLFPGIVNTANVYHTGLPRPLAHLAALGIRAFGRSPEQAADDVCRLATATEFGAGGGGRSGRGRAEPFYHPGLVPPLVVRTYADQLRDRALVDRVWAASVRAAAAAGAQIE